jgi:signal transduction histidine kinase
VTRERTLDVALAGGILVLAVAESLLSDGVTGPRGATAAVSGAMSLTLVWRRSRPAAATVAFVALAVAASASLVDPSEMIATFLPLLVLGYGAAAYVDARPAYALLALLVAGTIVVGLLDDSREAGNVYFPALLVALCWLGGRTARTRARRAAELHEAAALAADRREREAAEAVAGERRRIAREMHDVVAHSISLMVVQAGGARRILHAEPARAQQAAAAIRGAGTEALAEMGILLGVLESAPDVMRPPSLDGLGDLVARAIAAGLPARLDVIGTRRRLGAGAELAVYRVVQEALTNAIKHAGGATTRVRLMWTDDALELSVADDGDGGPVPRLEGAGHGLLGMRERLRVYGGDAAAGPRPGGGFEVRARLPYDGATSAAAAVPPR